MATKNNKKSTFNSSPPPYSPLANRSTPRTKSAPPQPHKKTNHNGFTRNVNDVLRRTSLTEQPLQNRKLKEAAEEEKATILPKYDRSKTVLDSHSPTIPPPVQDGAEAVALPKQDQRGSSGSEAVALLNAHGPIFSPLILDDKQVLGEDDDGEFDMLSLEHKAEEELYKRPKKGETYEAVDVKRIEKRLKHLSVINNNVGNNIIQTAETMIDEGLEIADSVSHLKINGTSSSKIVEMAGQKAQRAATLIIQAQIMFNKARELLAQSKDMLQAAEF